MMCALNLYIVSPRLQMPVFCQNGLFKLRLHCVAYTFAFALQKKKVSINLLAADIYDANKFVDFISPCHQQSSSTPRATVEQKTIFIFQHFN